MKCIAIIIARGGSKGIKNKNLVEVAKKPLLAWSIDHATKCKEIDEVYVSSDSKEILNCAKFYGCNVIHRPKRISSDTSTSEEAWIHALKYINDSLQVFPDLILAPQVTSPIRKVNDFTKAIKHFIKNDLDSLLSVNRMKDFFIWEKNKGIYKSFNYDFKKRPRRQLITEKYHENGSFYIFKPEILTKYKNRLGGKIGVYIMDKIQHFQIDEPEDIKTCDYILRSFKKYNEN